MKKNKRNFYMRAHRALAWLIRLIFRVRITGAENIPAGGAILCCNHIGYPDAVILGAAFPRQVHFLAKKELFRTPVIAPLARALGAVPVNRDNADVTAIKTVISLSQDGNLVAVFPQGHRYKGKNPADTPIKFGIGMMAYRSSMPVIPVCIRMKRQRYLIFRRVEIIVGTPITYTDVCTDGGRENYEKAASAFFARTCILGGYSPKTLPAAKPEDSVS